MDRNGFGHLAELSRLAERLFDIISDEVGAGAPVTVEFRRIDDLMDTDIEKQHLVATALLCTQLLHRVTADPDRAQPRQVQTLADIIDQVIPPLAKTLPGTSSGVSEALRDVGGSIAQTAFSLILLSDPGGPDYSAR